MTNTIDIEKEVLEFKEFLLDIYPDIDSVILENELQNYIKVLEKRI